MVFDPSPQKTIPAERVAEPFPWLLAYFRQIYEQASPQHAYQVESLHFAYTLDGLRWTAINQNRPVYIPEIEGRICSIRDPFIARGPDGFFHMLCTEATQGWCSKSLVYARSGDLIRWEEARRIPVMETIPGAKNAWSPEFIYDPTQEDYFVVWTSTLADKVSLGKHIWFARTRDFHDFSQPRPLFDPELNIIDAHILRTDGRNYLFFKPDAENATKYVRLAVADRLEGPYQILTGGITPPVSEGPQIMRSGDSDSWYLYYDLAYTNRYGLSTSKDLQQWEVVQDVQFPEDARHGSFLSVSENELANLLWRFDFRVLVEKESQVSIF